MAKFTNKSENKFIVQNLIDKELVQDEYEGSGKIIASNLGRCYRMQYWHRKNEKQTNPPDKRALRIFKAGDLFHKFIQNILVKQGYKAEIKFENNDIKFRADLVNKDEVVDLKSQHSRSFWYLQKNNADIRKERYTNWLQIMLGCEYLKRPQGRLVLISKDDLCIAEYVQPYDNFWQFELKGELEYLRYIWEKQELPEAKPRAYNGKECKYCSYADKCKQYEKNQIDTK